LSVKSLLAEAESEESLSDVENAAKPTEPEAPKQPAEDDIDLSKI
jgi:hypothetical protein